MSIAIRWNAIGYTGWFNPDEAELLAAGRRAAMQVWMPMATSSANTYLVLWPTTLGLLDLLGVPMSLRTAHTLSTGAYAAVIAMVWIATARRWGFVRTAVFIVPAAYWMLARYSDFFQMGSELPSVLLLVVGAVLAFTPGRAVSARRLAVVAALASLAPWFKVQSGLLAVGLVISACGFAFLSRDSVWTRREWTQRLLLLALGGLGPTAVLLAVMAVGGTLDLFWDEPVEFLRAYLTHNVKGLGYGLGETTAPLTEKLRGFVVSVLTNAFAFSWALLGLVALWSGTRNQAGRLARIAVWSIPMLAALATLLVMYPIYVHYLNFLFAGTAIAAIAAAGLAPAETIPDRGPSLLARRLPAWALLTTMVFLLAAVEHQGASPAPPAVAHQDEEDIAALCPRGSSVFVWGWAAELYAYYDWRPASRYVTYGLLLAKTPNQGHYRARFLQELTDDPPTCVVNAIGPAWFGDDAAATPLENEIPDTGGWLHRCYVPNRVVLRPAAAPEPELIDVWTRRSDC
ncbi:hypothetical protein [Terracoccus sp. 273MFTsu3.1]|uniref:hypothetical protein n=1 Tax=Terracoccus sp. 273MFTsu3.1 TaxID=1172188 RepID=UPI0012DF12C6|nr:hypothetical protein [Terracoccus sp. 273MFTsu3.1]